MICHGCVVTGRAGLALRAGAGVGAPVEAPARRALVDPPGAGGERLAQPGGVAAGLLDLVGHRRPVDAAVGHPARSAARSPPAPARGRLGRRGRRPASSTCCRSTSSSSCSSWPSRACVERLLERVGQRPAPAPRPRRRGRRCRRRGRRRRLRGRRRPSPSSAGGGSGGPMIARYSRAAWSSASSSPSAIQITRANSASSARRSSLAEHPPPQRRAGRRGRRGRAIP